MSAINKLLNKAKQAPEPESEEQEEEQPVRSTAPEWVDETEEEAEPSGKLKVGIRDHGLFVSVGKRVGEEADAHYFRPWEDGSPKPEGHFVGYGVKGLTRIDSFFDFKNGKDNDGNEAKKPDLIVFPDVGEGDLQEDLRSQGIDVFGTGKGEEIEDDRIKFREILKDLGLPVAPYIPVRGGTEELRKKLSPLKNKWVKLSLYRGLGETFHWEDYETSRGDFYTLAHKLDILDRRVEFIIEDDIPDAIEIGAEWMRTVGAYLPLGLYGWEAKNKGYFGLIEEYDSLPKPIKLVMDKFGPVYDEYGVRGELSVEMRVNKNGPHFMDPCMRFPSPPGESLCRAYKNMVAMMQAVAQGRVIRPIPTAKYFFQFMLQSREATHESTAVSFPEKFEKNLFFRYEYVDDDGRVWILPFGETVQGAAVGWGDTPQAAHEMALAAAQSVDGADLYFDKDVYEKLKKEVEKSEEFGIKIGDKL